MNCATCRFSRPAILDDESGPTLECRRYPPQIFIVDDEVSQASPQVEETDWCGEWAAS